MSQAERSFFEEILSFESQGWRVAIPDSAVPGTLNLGDLSVHVYVVDVPGGQFWRGAISPADFQNTIAHCAAQGSTNSSRVIAAVERMRRYESFAEGEDRLVQEIVTLGAWAFAGSRTLELAQEKHSLSGHWIMVYYGTRNGNYINRPVYVSQSTGGEGPMPPPTLLSLIKQIVSADTQDMGSAIAVALDNDGGAEIHERFRT